MPEEETKEGVQTEEGKPEAKEQASASEEQAEDDGVIALDVTKKYHSKRRPDVLVSGDELMAGYDRGQRFDKVQSELHKLQAQSEADAGKIATQTERIAQFESNDRLAKSLQELGIATTGQKPVAQPQEGEDWLTPGEEPQTPPTVNPKEIASRLDAIQTELASRVDPDKIDKMVKERVAELYSTEQEKRNAQEAANNADATIRSAKLAELKVSMPDISGDAFDDLVDADADYIKHALEGRQLLREGDSEAGIGTIMDGLARARSVKNKELDLMAEQRKITAKRELDAELESFSTGSLPGAEGEKLREPIRNAKEAAKKAEANLAESHKMVDRQKVAKNSAM